jgi:hypothetical protein
MSSTAPFAAPPATPIGRTDDNRIAINRFAQAEQKRTVYRVTLPEGVAFEATLHPTYWAHVSTRLVPYDRIEVLAEDGRFFGELLVTKVSRTEAHMAKLSLTDLDPSMKTIPSHTTEDMKVSWKGEMRKFVIERMADNTVIREGIDQRSVAISEAEAYARSLDR